MANMKYSIVDNDSDYNEFSSLFEEKMNDHNSKVVETTASSATDEELIKLYKSIIEKYNTLCTNYSNGIKQKQLDIMDTFVQIMNMMLYQKDILMNFEKFNNLIKYIKNVLSDDSAIMKLLNEIQALLRTYLNFSKYTATTNGDRIKYIKLEAEELKYSNKEYDLSNIKDEITNILSDLSVEIVTYNKRVEESKKKADKLPLITSSDIDKYILSETEINPIEELFTKYKNNLSKYKMSFTDNGVYYTATNVVAIDSGAKNHDEFSSSKTYYTYNEASDTYTKMSITEFDNSSTYYTIDWVESSNVSNILTSTEEDPNAGIVSFRNANYDQKIKRYSKGTVNKIDYYVATTTGLEFINNLIILLDLDNSVNNYSINLYKNTFTELSEIKEKIKAINNSIPERASTKSKINELIEQFLNLLNQYLSELSILPDYSLGNPDSSGHCNITAEYKDVSGETQSMAKSFFVKKFTGNRFYGYMGEINRSGFVGQKAQIYAYVPVKENSTERLNKTMVISSPLMDINAYTFEHDPKNVVFGLFNVYDYRSKIRIENDGEGDNEKVKEQYVTDYAAVRFGNILSAKDIDMEADEQSFRMRVDSSSSWVSGKINKKGLFEISDVNLIAKFNGELVGDYVTYSNPEKFSDAVSLSYTITDINTGAVYTFASEDDLTLDEEYTLDENIKGLFSTSSYYKGTMKFTSENSQTSSSDSELVSVNYFENKDIIVRITKSYDGIYDIGVYLDPDSDTNSSFYEDSGNDPAVYLPMIANNFSISTVSISSTIQIEKSNTLQSASALLDLANLLNGEFDPLSELTFSTIMDRFNSAKSLMTDELLSCLNTINNIATFTQTVTSIYSSYDPNYTDTYTSDIATAYSNIQTTISEYTTDETADITSLCDDSLVSKLKTYIDEASDEIYNVMEDIIESETTLSSYSDKLCLVMKNGRNELNISSTLSALYNIVTGNSETITTLSSAGTFTETYNIKDSFSEWIIKYREITDSVNYEISTSDLQYLYVISQLYSIVNDKKYNLSYLLVNRFYKTILLRILKENISNYFTKNLFVIDEDNSNKNIVSIVENYIAGEKEIDCEYFDFNKYFINPYIIELFPQLKVINTFDIDNLTSIETNADVEQICKAPIYKAILETNPNIVRDKLEKLYGFVTNGQRLNVREIIFVCSLLSVLKEINDSEYEELENYKLEISDFDKTTYVNCILKYKNLINSDSSPLNLLCDSEFKQLLVK